MNAKGHDWIAALPQLTQTTKRHGTRANAVPLAPGTSFHFDEEPADRGLVSIAATVPTHTLGIHVWIPPVLQDQLLDVTRGANRSTVLAALADRAVERIREDKLAVVARGIRDPEEAQRAGSICHFDVSRTKGDPSFTIDGSVTPPGSYRHLRERRRIPLPQDTRQAIQDLVDYEQGPASLSRATLMLAQWALQDLARRKRWLLIRKPSV